MNLEEIETSKPPVMVLPDNTVGIDIVVADEDYPHTPRYAEFQEDGNIVEGQYLVADSGKIIASFASDKTIDEVANFAEGYRQSKRRYKD